MCYTLSVSGYRLYSVYRLHGDCKWQIYSRNERFDLHVTDAQWPTKILFSGYIIQDYNVFIEMEKRGATFPTTEGYQLIAVVYNSFHSYRNVDTDNKHAIRDGLQHGCVCHYVRLNKLQFKYVTFTLNTFSRPYCKQFNLCNMFTNYVQQWRLCLHHLPRVCLSTYLLCSIITVRRIDRFGKNKDESDMTQRTIDKIKGYSRSASESTISCFWGGNVRLLASLCEKNVRTDLEECF